jgi:hypothetical protein
MGGQTFVHGVEVSLLLMSVTSRLQMTVTDYLGLRDSLVRVSMQGSVAACFNNACYGTGIAHLWTVACALEHTGPFAAPFEGPMCALKEQSLGDV